MKDLAQICKRRPGLPVICILDEVGETATRLRGGSRRCGAARRRGGGRLLRQHEPLPWPGASAPASSHEAATRTAFAKLRRVVADLRSGVFSATVALNLMNIIAESVERAVLFLVRRESLTALGAFGFNQANRPLGGGHARSHRSISRGTTPWSKRSASAAPSRSPSTRQPLPERLVRLVGSPANEQVVVFPVLGSDRVILVIYTDNGHIDRPIEEIDIIDLAAAEVGIAFENELLRRQLEERLAGTRRGRAYARAQTPLRERRRSISATASAQAARRSFDSGSTSRARPESITAAPGIAPDHGRRLVLGDGERPDAGQLPHPLGAVRAHSGQQHRSDARARAPPAPRRTARRPRADGRRSSGRMTTGATTSRPSRRSRAGAARRADVDASRDRPAPPPRPRAPASGRWALRRSAKARVKPLGMCWTISTGTCQSPRRSDSTCSIAGGPPVEAPITSARSPAPTLPPAPTARPCRAVRRSARGGSDAWPSATARIFSTSTSRKRLEVEQRVLLLVDEVGGAAVQRLDRLRCATAGVRRQDDHRRRPQRVDPVERHQAADAGHRQIEGDDVRAPRRPGARGAPLPSRRCPRPRSAARPPSSARSPCARRRSRRRRRAAAASIVLLTHHSRTLR